MLPLDLDKCLVIQSATIAGFVGLFAQNTWLKTIPLGLQPLECVVPAIQQCLEESFQKPGFENIHSIIYAKGPGSTLGLRVTEMFLSTLQQLHPSIGVHAYNTLVLYALQLKNTDHHILCPNPDHSWQVLSCHKGALRIETLQAPALKDLPYPIYYLPLRKKHPQLPEKAQALPLEGVPRPEVFSEAVLYSVGL